MKASDIMEVFKAGKMVANPAFWKQKTIDANTIVVLISGLVWIINFFDCSICDLQLTNDQIIGITTGIISLVGIFNNVSTAATSKKVGLKVVEKITKSTPVSSPKPSTKIEVDVDDSEVEDVTEDLSDEISKLQ